MNILAHHALSTPIMCPREMEIKVLSVGLLRPVVQGMHEVMGGVGIDTQSMVRRANALQMRRVHAVPQMDGVVVHGITANVKDVSTSENENLSSPNCLTRR